MSVEMQTHAESKTTLYNSSFPERRTHINARTGRPPFYPERFPVPENLVSWDIPYPGYTPATHFDNKLIAPDSNHDSTDIKKVYRDLKSFEGHVIRDNHDYPLNPVGRTGIHGMGCLWRWGANFAVDCLVTRFNSATKQLEMIAIQRSDTHQWAMPGGFVDATDSNIKKAAEREFREECGGIIDLANAQVLYQGYDDDPRNTDNAWIETSVLHTHISNPTHFSELKLKAGDDARDLKWLPLIPEEISKLYGAHVALVNNAIKELALC